MTLAVGFFDGVHLGHQAILKGADAALTFYNHPLGVLKPDRAPQLIMRLEERLAAIYATGVKEVRVLKFTPELAAQSAAEFAAALGDKVKIRCGANWRFGRGGEGSPDWLKARGTEVEVVPYAVYQGEVISSSRIRGALAEGDLSSARAMLGRDYVISGGSVRGKGEGAKIGYPTLNLKPEALVPSGVYSAVVNYGTAPTFGARAWKEPTLEVHLLKRLREERKFASVEELKKQIAADIAATEETFK